MYKASEWESAGYWYVSDVSNLANNSGAWWIPVRILGLSLTDYILLLKDDFHATQFKFFDYGEDKNNSLLLFKFNNYTDSHKYLLYINRKAREYQRRKNQ